MLWPLLYLGAVCSFVAQTIQVAAQRHTSAPSAGLIMMLEGFFGSVFSVLIGFEPLSAQLFVGGVLIMPVSYTHLDVYKRQLFDCAVQCQHYGRL